MSKKQDKAEALNPALLAVLQSAGIETEGLTQEEAIEKVNDIVRQNKKLQEDLVTASQTREEEEKSIVAKKMTSYMQTPDSLLTNKSFIARLYQMGVPNCFLKLFRDHDETLNDRKIWEMIRKSGIKVYEHDMGELLSKRRPYGRKVDHKVDFAQ
jgi:anion-transporting  ArsA/GET3 family ATPase